MEVLQFDKLNCICGFTQRRTYGVQERSFTEPQPKNHTINCLTFEENTRQPYNDNLCLFRALALHMHKNQRLGEETSKLLNFGLSANQLQGVLMNDNPIV